MKVQLAVVGLVITAVLFSMPGFRAAAIEAMPDLGDDDPSCRQIVCGQRQVPGKNSPEVKFQPY